MQIFRFSTTQLHLDIEYVPCTVNERADYLSKVREEGDWWILFEI